MDPTMMADTNFSESGIFPAEDSLYISDFLKDSEAAVVAFRKDVAAREHMFALAGAIVTSLRAGGRLLVAGNGGSAADAQHIAGEFTARLMYDRRPLSAIALTTDTSSLTAISNDYGYEYVFSRQVQAYGRPGDVFLGISTSGRSPNIIKAFDAAREGGMICAAMTGRRGMDFACDITLRAPEDRTALVQQIHIMAAHCVCALVERALCPKKETVA